MSLHILGLSDLQVRAYEALTSVPSATLDELAATLDVEREMAASLTGELARRELAVRRGDRYVAVRPAVALGALFADRQAALRAAEAALVEMDDTFRAVRQGVVPDVVIDLVHGAEEVAARLRQIQLRAEHEVLSLVKAPVSVLESTENDAEDVAVARGVQYRVVLERAMLQAEPRLVEEVHRARAAGEQVRVASRVPTKLFIIDREIALVPLGIGTAPVESAFLLGPSGLLDALIALFDAVWDAAQEFDVGPGGPDGDDVRLLTMLLAGMTDEAIARDLDISVRTVQRRVRSLLDLARVETRLQLGYVIARRGWAPGNRVAGVDDSC